ncbi:MAG: PAS domain S-box protein [Methanoregula sp.]|jgi:PAS domain S-box-containing protein
MFSVLYVDDEPGLLEIGRLFLEKTGGFTVTCTESGNDALDLLSKNAFDAIVSDYQMPGMDGIELLKSVRAGYGKIPFILFTGRGREEVVIAAINNGADFYLQKGGDPKTLFAELSHKLRQSIGRVRAEKELSDSKKQLADIINFLPDPTFAINVSGIVIAWNRAMEEMTGTPASDILGKGDYEYARIIYGDRRPMIVDLVCRPDEEFEKAHYAYIQRTPTTLTAETVFKKEGRPGVHLWGKASHLYNENGELIGAIESMRDITEIKRTEVELRAANEQLVASGEELKSQYDELARGREKLQESEAQYRILTESSPDLIYIIREGRFIYVNKYFADYYGYSADEFKTMHVTDFLHPDERVRVIAFNDEVLAGKVNTSRFTARCITRAGEIRTLEYCENRIPYKGAPAILGVARDVTDQVKREAELHEAYDKLSVTEEELRSQYNELATGRERLQESEEKYRSLAENSPDLIYIIRDDRILYFNTVHLEYLGYTEEELRAVSVKSLLYPEDLAHVLKCNEDLLSGKIQKSRFTVRTRLRSGEVRSFDHYESVIQYEGGPAILGIARDVTEREKRETELREAYDKLASAEEELRTQYNELAEGEKKILESEEKYRTLVEHSQNGIFITQEGRLMFYNKGFRDILGYGKGELDGMEIARLVAPEDREMVLSRHYGRTGGKDEPEVYEFLMLCKNQVMKRRVKILVGLGSYNGRPATIGTIHDVTEEREREEALRTSEESYRTLGENMQDIVYRTDRDGNNIMISPSGVSLLGYDSVEELEGKPVAETFYCVPDNRREFLELLAKNGSVKNFETVLRRKDGKPVYVSTSSHYYYDHEGNVLGVEGVLHDITEIKQKEQELKKAYEQISTAEEELRQQYHELEQSERMIRESETRLRYMLDFYKHPEKTEKELFDEAVEGAGVVTGSPLGYLALLSEDEAELKMHAWSKSAMATCLMDEKPPVYLTEKTGLWGEAVRQRRAVITNDYAGPSPGKKGLPPGHPQITRHMNIPVFDGNRIVLVAGVANKKENYTDRDVQELQLLMQSLWQVIRQKRADASLARERRFTDALIDSVPGLLYLYDEEGKLVRWNLNYENAWGYSPKDLSRMKFTDWFRDDPKTAALIREKVQTALRDGFADAEIGLTNKDGEKKHYYFTAVPLEIDGKKYFTGVGIDITERVKAQEENTQRRRQLEEITATIPVVVYQFYATPDNRWGISYVSGRSREIFGVENVSDNFYDWFRDHIHAEDLSRFLDSIGTALKNRQNWRFEGRFVKPSGEVIWIQAMANPVAESGSQIYSGVMLDITERKKVAEALRDSETKYRMLVENSHDIIYTLTPEGTFTFVSPAWTVLLGHPVSDVVGRSFRDFVHPEDASRCGEFLCATLQSGKQPVGITYRVFHADGSIRYNISNLFPVYDPAGNLVSCIGTARDITDLRLSEVALKETNKKLHLLNSISRHDMANQVMIVQACADMAKRKKPSQEIDSFLTGILEATDVISRQIGFMRMYQDLGVKSPSWFRIDELALSTDHPGLTVTSSCGPAEIYADPLIGRVFFNLYDNTLRHGKTATQVSISCNQRENDLVISIEDNGAGILPGEKEVIFEKGFGKNTGFGLFLTREILAITGMAIHETGAYGKGARFEITVPNGSYRQGCART